MCARAQLFFHTRAFNHAVFDEWDQLSCPAKRFATRGAAPAQQRLATTHWLWWPLAPQLRRRWPTVWERTCQPHRGQETREQALDDIDTESVAELLAPLGIRHHLVEFVWVHALQTTALPNIEEPTSVGDPDFVAGAQAWTYVTLRGASPLAGVDREEPGSLQRLALVAQEFRWLILTRRTC